MNTLHTARLRRGALALFALPLLATAQTAGSGETDDSKVLKLEKFEVTGSYIPIAGTATAIPVATIDSKAIENTAINTNVLDLLRKTMPMFTGNNNLGDTNANISGGSTGGGARVAFRNVQTLVLINGRRAAFAPILASGGAQFVDVNLIPMSAIDRIEILQDGASAIYGTDAVSGVINIILKSDLKGIEVRARYGSSDNPGHYSERSVSLAGGASDDKTSITVAAEWTKTDPLFQREREFSNPIYGTGTFAGVIAIGSQTYVLNPTLNAPPNPGTHVPIETLVANGTYIPVNSSNLISGTGPEQQYAFNLAEYVTLLLENKRRSATIDVDHKWTDRVSMFGTLLYSATNTYSQLNAQPFSATIAATDPSNPTNVAVSARNRLVVAPRQSFFSTNSIQGIIGLRGTFGDDWRWETAANKNTIKQDFVNRNLVATAQRQSAVAAGTINMFARQQAPGAIEAAGLLGAALGQATSELTTYDARLTGTAWHLPGGDLGFAVGGDYRVEFLKQDADRLSQTPTFGWDSATTLDPFEKSRNIKSIFADVRIPVFGPAQKIKGLHLLELEAAVRHEIYSDTEDPTVPKYSMRWLPFDDQFAIRATYSKSFSAPSLPLLFGPGGIGFTASLNLQRFGGGAPITGQANSRNGANSALLPSHSENYTFGVVYSPKALKSFSISLDYFNVKQTDLISTIGSANILQSVELLGTASPFANRVRIGPPGDTSQFTTGAPITAPGQIGSNPIQNVYVTDRLVNISAQNQSGFDIKAEYTWNSDKLGRFDFGMSAGYYDSFEVQTLPTVSPFETVGLASTVNGTIPEYMAYTSIDWNRGAWGASLGWQYIPSVTDVNALSTTDVTADSYVEPYNSVDVAVRYTFGSGTKWLKGLSVRIGANNVFNETPPMAKGTFTQANADIATYGAVGRLIYAEAKYRF